MGESKAISVGCPGSILSNRFYVPPVASRVPPGQAGEVAYCECGRKIVVRVSPQRSPNGRVQSQRRTVKGHNMCRQCQARMWEAMKLRKQRKEEDNEAS